MFKLRYGLAVNIVWFSILYNIERLNEPINIATFVYLLIPSAILILTIFSFFHEKKKFNLFTLLIIIVFLILKSTFGYEVWGDALAITVFEAVCVFISLWLYQYYVHNVFEFENMVNKLTFRQLGIPPRLYVSRDAEDLYREVKRSRRFEHPLSLYLLEPVITDENIEHSIIMKDLQAMMLKRFIQAQLANIISDSIRDTDLIVQEGNGFALMFPETNADEAAKLIEYVRDAVNKQIHVDIQVGRAQFPDNAITLNGLFQEAQNRLENAQNHKTMDNDDNLNTESDKVNKNRVS
jgi:hypothetical protein